MVAIYKGYFFDFDGTLAQTMEDNFLAWERAFADFDLIIAPGWYYPLEGLPLAEVALSLHKRSGRKKIDYGELVTRKERYYLERHRFALYPGVESLINALQARDVKLAIVTAAKRARLAHSVPPDFLAQFDCLITEEASARGKPNPDPYLAAARFLNLDPRECLVVENAPLGVAAAKNAHMYCIGVCSTVGPRELTQADEVVPKIAALLQHPLFTDVSQ